MQSTITYKLSIYLRLKRIRMKIETSRDQFTAESERNITRSIIDSFRTLMPKGSC